MSSPSVQRCCCSLLDEASAAAAIALSGAEAPPDSVASSAPDAPWPWPSPPWPVWSVVACCTAACSCSAFCACAASAAATCSAREDGARLGMGAPGLPLRLLELLFLPSRREDEADEEGGGLRTWVAGAAASSCLLGCSISSGGCESLSARARAASLDDGSRAFSTPAAAEGDGCGTAGAWYGASPAWPPSPSPGDTPVSLPLV